MSIESILESQPWVTTNPTSGTIGTTSGSANVVGVGTVFTTDVAVGDLLLWTDSAGNARMTEVKTVTDNLNIVAGVNIGDTVAGASFFIIKAANLTIPYFLADNSRNKSYLVEAQDSIVATGANLSQISGNEGINLKSIYVRMPYQYTWADSRWLIGVRYRDAAGGNLGYVDTVGEGGLIQLPIENIEVPLADAYIPPPAAAAGSTWQLALEVIYAASNLETAEGFGINQFDVPAVSQISGPASLNGNLLPVFVGTRIVHASVTLT